MGEIHHFIIGENDSSFTIDKMGKTNHFTTGKMGNERNSSLYNRQNGKNSPFYKLKKIVGKLE